MQIHAEIFKNLINLRKVFLKNKDNTIFTDAWFKNEVPRSKLFSISMKKPSFLKRLFFLYIDDNYWKSLEFYLNRGKTNLDPDKDIIFYTSGYRDDILKIIFLVEGYNLSDTYNHSREFYKSLEDIVYRVLQTIESVSSSGGWFDNDLGSMSIDYTIKYSNKKSLIEQQNEEVIGILKTAKLYIEAMSVIWKFNEIKDKDSDDIDTFAVNYFTLHGLHKIIGGKSQSIRNLISQKVSDTDNKWKESEIDQINLHDFVLKQNNTDRTKTKIKALETKTIIEYLKQQGYVISLNLIRLPVYIEHGQRILGMYSADKDTIKQIETELGLREPDANIKVLGASDYIQTQMATNYFHTLISFDKPDDEIYDLLEILNKYKEIITIDKEFLEVKNKIDRVGLNKFYKKSESFLDNTKLFKHLYVNHKAEFIKVISTINKIKELISNYDHLVILTDSRKNLALMKPLAAISKYLLNEENKYTPVLSTLIVSYPVNNLEQVNEVMNLNEVSKDSFQEDELEKLKKSFDSVLYLDSNLLLEYQEDMNNHINFDYKEIKKFIQIEIINILETLGQVKSHALTERFDHIDNNMYKEYIKNMSRAGTIYISKRNQKQWKQGFIDEKYNFQRREPNQNRKRLIAVQTGFKRSESYSYYQDEEIKKEEDNLKLLLNSKPGDEDKFIWFESDLSDKKYDYYISLIEI
tara:strand:- start:374 stop:2449 length:2076 start_codon:yes stop_codon:yes gene_type:complete